MSVRSRQKFLKILVAMDGICYCNFFLFLDNFVIPLKIQRNIKSLRGQYFCLKVSRHMLYIAKSYTTFLKFYYPKSIISCRVFPLLELNLLRAEPESTLLGREQYIFLMKSDRHQADIVGQNAKKNIKYQQKWISQSHIWSEENNFQKPMILNLSPYVYNRCYFGYYFFICSLCNDDSSDQFFYPFFVLES